MKEPVIRERSSCRWCRLRGLDRRGASHSPSSSLSLVQGRGRGPAEAQWQGRYPACIRSREESAPDSKAGRPSLLSGAYTAVASG